MNCTDFNTNSVLISHIPPGRTFANTLDVWLSQTASIMGIRPTLKGQYTEGIQETKYEGTKDKINAYRLASTLSANIQSYIAIGLCNLHVHFWKLQ